jgi:hypothetical protein
MNKTQTPFQFFREHAGFSYDPKTEIPAQGKAKCARALASAEAYARDHLFTFEWSEDPDSDSSDFCDDTPIRPTWQCICRDRFRDVIASLGGIDFGPNGEPWSENYKRVVEAELASEGRAALERYMKGNAAYAKAARS